MIMAHTDSIIIKEYAVKHGMVTLLQDGIAKAAEGITTIEEVMRVS
jgi:general secretion pathway protein E